MKLFEVTYSPNDYASERRPGGLVKAHEKAVSVLKRSFWSGHVYAVAEVFDKVEVAK